MLSLDEVAGKHVLSPGTTCLPPPAAGEGMPPPVAPLIAADPREPLPNAMRPFRGLSAVDVCRSALHSRTVFAILKESVWPV